jgi:peptidoglycan/LPS O-acetylase OafA/YrhL
VSYASVKRLPQLDSVRGLAVLVVLLHNTDKHQYTGPLARNGWMGVDLFFVLSGFLITGILLDTKNTKGYFRKFYIRRCLRIWPLYYCALLFMFVVVPLLRPSEAHRIFEPRSMPWWSYFVYIQNFLVPAITQATGLLGVTWSLAVEEQFYAVWPIVIRWCSEAQLRNLTLALFCASPALRFFLVHRGFNVYPNTFCRLDGLMAGALLALAFRSKSFSHEAYVRVAWVVLLIALPLAVITSRVQWVVYSCTALASVAFVYLALCSKQKWLHAILGNRFLIYTGTISYGIYLLEKIPTDATMSLHFDRHPLLALPLTAAATYALAMLSWNLLEKPFLRLKRFFEAGRVVAPPEAAPVRARDEQAGLLRST